MSLSNYFVKPVKSKSGYTQITTTVDDIVPIYDTRSGDYSFDYEQLAQTHPELLYNVNDSERAIKFCEIIPILVKEVQELKRLLKGDKKVVPLPLSVPVPLPVPVLSREPVSEIYEPEPAENKPIDLMAFEPVFRR
jgi:hypothetical protein